MSENLDLVRSIYAAWERGDFSSTEWAHPEIEYVFVDGPTPGTWTGLVAAGEAFRDYLGAWDGYGLEAEEYRELDAERVLVLVRLSGSGKTSGLELARMGARGASLFYLRGGKVTRFVNYFDGDHALADVGLKE
jgi:ketosteroid isomerase-like protein